MYISDESKKGGGWLLHSKAMKMGHPVVITPLWFSPLQVMKINLDSSARAALLEMVASSHVWQFRFIEINSDSHLHWLHF